MNRRNYIKRATILNRKYESKYYPKVLAAVKPTALIGVIKANGVQAGMRFLNEIYSNPKLSKTIESLYLEVGKQYARMNYRRMREEKKKIELKGFGFNDVWTRFIQDYLQRFLIEKITYDVAAATRDYLLKVLQKAITDGLGVDQIVKKLEDLPFTKSQAARIVRTEINRASNVGSKAQSETFEYEQQKVWISALDRRTRGNPIEGQDDHANHWSLNGTRIDEGEKFKDPRNGDLLDHPGDPNASASSTINCRCQVAYVAKRDGKGRLIPKQRSAPIIDNRVPKIAI